MTTQQNHTLQTVSWHAAWNNMAGRSFALPPPPPRGAQRLSNSIEFLHSIVPLPEFFMLLEDRELLLKALRGGADGNRRNRSRQTHTDRTHAHRDNITHTHNTHAHTHEHDRARERFSRARAKHTDASAGRQSNLDERNRAGVRDGEPLADCERPDEDALHLVQNRVEALGPFPAADHALPDRPEPPVDDGAPGLRGLPLPRVRRGDRGLGR
mmetsp:Transcript_14677/g.35824  ORF Transcript_14677/g.35824 Transcript_14677/m.35824 type:complete len:212 (+) Transcript_14677:65-700(+)